MEESGKKTPGVMNLDRLRPRGVKRRLTEGEGEESKRGERIRRKKQGGRFGTEEEEVEVEEEDDDDDVEESSASRLFPYSSRAFFIIICGRRD